mgnify:CR=1 FL=1
MKEKILVTGGTGYIGSHTVVELQNAGYEVIIIDNLSNSSADVVDNIEKVSGIRPVFEKLDCLDYAGLDAIFTKYKGIKAIIHFAASKAVGESVEKPLLYYRNNLVSLINRPGFTDQPPRTDAETWSGRYCIFFFLYSIWSAGSTSRNRRGAYQKSGVALWEYQADKRRDCS